MGRNKKTRSSVPVGAGGALPPMDDKVDLIQLLSTITSPTEDDVLNLLYARFKSDLPYTRLNASSLVVVNPNKPLESMNDASAKEYAEHWYKDSTANIDNPAKNLQPHIYEFAAKIYLHMRRSAEDQSVIFSGITGSGKTATQGHLLSQLLLLSTHTKKEAKIANQIQNVQIILEAFGNSKTVQNINASRFGKYLELQFNERGRIVGSKALTYCFDRSRVTEIPQDERSYHVFYYLLAGATQEERSSAHLQDPQHYNYLSQSKCYRIPEVDDSIQMEDLRGALKTLGFKSKVVNQIWQILSVILLLGNIEFTNPGKAKDEAANIKNRHVLDMAAQYLGVPAFKLEQTLTFKSKYIGKELCTVVLNAELATEQRDALSRALYSILFTWIVEHINSKLDQSDEPPNFISLLDQPGPQNFSKNSFEQFCLNFVTEELENYVLKQIFDDNSGFNLEITNDGINLPQIETMDNSGCVELLRGDSNIINTTKSSNQPGGLISILDLESAKIQSGIGANDSKLLRAFGINHFTGQVIYSIDNFIDKNNDNLSTDFIDLFKETHNSFILKLFSGPALAIENHPKNERTVVVAQLPNKPFRSPMTQLHGTLNQLIGTLSQTRLWNIFQIRPNDVNEPDIFDNKRVKTQIRNLVIPDIITRKRIEYTSSYTFEEFINRNDFAIGAREIFLSDNNWKILEDQLRTIEREERVKAKLRDDESLSGENRGIGNTQNASSAASSVDRLLPKNNNNDGVDYTGSEVGYYDSYAESEDDYFSQAGHDDEEGNMWEGGDRKGSNDGDINEDKGIHEEIEELPTTKIRRWWVVFVWLCTWWIPSFLLNWIVYSTTDVSYHTGDDDFWVSVRGVVYDLSKFHLTNHAKASAQQAGLAEMEPYGGKDVSTSIPIPLNQPETCVSLVGTSDFFVDHLNDTDNFFKHSSGTNAQFTSLKDIRWYWNNFLPTMELYKKAELVYDKKDIEAQGTAGRKWAIINDKVYDLTDYFQAHDTYSQPTPPTQEGVRNYHYLNSDIETLFEKRSGQDITKQIFSSQISAQDRYTNLLCLNSAFYVGKLDFRKSFRCVFNNYILLAAACLMASVILVKFLAALQLGSRRKPEDHDKFVICQVPCYTEGEESLKRTMDSLAALNYDDKRKLLFFIADGMIVGSGNDRPTPRIVLDILGVDPKIDPEPLRFKSIGEGAQQLNYGKVYSGLYEYEGHVVPYLVVVKVGKPSEKSKPGNRGKRDSQIILMKFLNKVHFEDEMTPLELEIYHQMKNVIGVNPSFYEYVLMVDADTEVLPDALNRMISCMLHDGRVIGICGETTLVNEEGSWTTMIQVYEYYISHHLAKAFESLFGSVTCLPGCFCMYRIRTPIKSSPLIISNSVIDNYSENHVDTLHKKNLLSLGEDRYLTTLMMKHFPQYKMTFTPDAKCRTAAPDRWSVLLSQRRRWINSTIHNLMELMFLSEMCGVCCFSMRFVVFIDLFGTLILPSTTIYIVYLIWAVASERQALPTIALIMLAAVYGLQAIIFILKQQWQHIGWMIIYLLAFPLFSFFIPIYSFWHFDDFSWGNTRVVVGEKGKKQIITAGEEKFDESMITKKKWADYEQEIWEGTTAESHDSKHSEVSRYSYKSNRSNNRFETGSQYGGSNYGGSQYGGSQNQDYFRDTHLSPNDRGRQRSRSPVPRYSPSEPRSSRVVKILMEIRIILNNANLMNITKKQGK
ncbi:9528_t:CDS:2 [Diversispora eburnea]|uniref:chitin synthase n=1 Tax=Diversispora eburnea TaxID=1213867 RepID=A0A9N9FQN5_9GLOM|nr:9528_t:CDS:2 [Diversispora eburnea]